MSFRGKFLQYFFEPRRAELRRVLADPLTTQREQLRWLLERGSRTEIGRRYAMDSIKSISWLEVTPGTPMTCICADSILLKRMIWFGPLK